MNGNEILWIAVILGAVIGIPLLLALVFQILWNTASSVIDGIHPITYKKALIFMVGYTVFRKLFRWQNR
ncbi:MAG: hypothetical protein M1421_03930 [Candidatus Eremiobacteraeota bacterium]|jgi:hypothetical protein|nr:hypothetical protein [Candidatus Eremiobacteraeota bacterium]MCL5056293.1 hypothetical protein [Bacillota bacterium]